MSDFSFIGTLQKILMESGFAAFAEDPRSLIMIIVACVLFYMGIGKKFEPLLLVPIAFGILLSNFPLTGMLNEPAVIDGVTKSPGFLWVIYQGVQHAIYPSIIFLGIGAMTDFGPLIARPSSLLLGAAAQLGIFTAFLLALALGFEPAVAAAIGAGIDISKANGNMIVDIGGGTTDIAVISLGGIVESTSIKIAGDKFDEAIVKYIRRKHNVLIGDRTAEAIKREIGCVYPRPEEASMEIKGRCLMTGLPRTFTVESHEIMGAFDEVSSTIVEAIHGVLERTPPELTGDISTNGIVMTGGGALIWGFDKLIAAKTGIPTRVADDAISCVALGTGNCLENLDKMQDGTMNLSRRRQMMN